MEEAQKLKEEKMKELQARVKGFSGREEIDPEYGHSEITPDMRGM